MLEFMNVKKNLLYPMGGRIVSAEKSECDKIIAKKSRIKAATPKSKKAARNFRTAFLLWSQYFVLCT
jgi:hypothetical protein